MATVRSILRWVLGWKQAPPAVAAAVYAATINMNLSPTANVNANPLLNATLDGNPSPAANVKSG